MLLIRWRSLAFGDSAECGLYPTFRTSDNSAVKTAASDTKSAEAVLRFPTRVGGFCNTSGGFNRW